MPKIVLKVPLKGNFQKRFVEIIDVFIGIEIALYRLVDWIED